MPENPAISVVIPTYNAAKFLREALDSLVAQTFTDWEAVCVNDGSTDNSLEILQEYAAKDARFRILDGPNGGYGKAMNRGMDAARGKYMAILEPDDYLPPNAYAVLHAAAERHGLDIARGAVCHFWQENGKRVYRCHYENVPKLRVLCPKEHPCAFKAAPNTWTCLYRMGHLRSHGIRHHESPGASYQDDGMFFLNMAYAERCMWVDDIVYMYRVDNPASSIQAGAKKPFAEMEEFAYIRRRMEETPEVWEKVKKFYVGLYVGAQRWIYPRIYPETRMEFLRRFCAQIPELRELGMDLPERVMADLALMESSPDDFCRSGIWLEQSGGGESSPQVFFKTHACFGLPIASLEVSPARTVRKVFGVPVMFRERQRVLHDMGRGDALPLVARDTYKVFGIPLYCRDSAGTSRVMHWPWGTAELPTTLHRYPEVGAVAW